MENNLFSIFVSLGVPGLALGIFYMLFKEFKWEFPKVPSIYVGPIIILFMLLTFSTIYYALILWSPKEVASAEGKNTLKPDGLIRKSASTVTEDSGISNKASVSGACPNSSLEEILKHAETFLHEKKFYEAIECYSNALKIDPTISSVWREKGKAYIGLATGTTDFSESINNSRKYELEYFVKAMPCFKRAINLDPNDKEAHLYLGLAYYRWGNLHPQLGPSNDNQNSYSQFQSALNLKLNQVNIDIYKWQYESSCAFYGIALSMARLSHKLGTGYKEDAKIHLKKAVDTSPTCISPSTSFDDVLYLTRELPSDSNSAYVTPPSVFQ